MELNEAVRRMAHHWVLVISCLLLGAAVAFAVHVGDVRMYLASTRLVLDTPDPRALAESAAIADTARAIATSPTHVAAALSQVTHAQRDAVEIASHRVTVDALGSSGVLRLSVRDEDPGIAAALANALAADLIQTRLDVTQGGASRIEGDLSVQIDGFNNEITKIDGQISNIQSRLAVATAPDIQSAARARLSALTRQRDYLVWRRIVLQSQLDSLVTADAGRPNPSIIEKAVPLFETDDTSGLPDMALGALLGLMLGLGIAALVETFWPTLVGSYAVARAVDAPLLGETPGPPERATASFALLARSLGLAAEAAGVRVVEVVSLGPAVELDPLVLSLQAPANTEARSFATVTLPASIGSQGPTVPSVDTASLHQGKNLLVREFGSMAPAPPNGDASGHGLVAVSPRTLKSSNLATLSSLRQITSWPVLGVICYRPKRWLLIRWVARDRRWAGEARP